MDNKTFYCLLYILSLLPYCFMTNYETEEENRDKRFVPLAIPVYLVGRAVAPRLFWRLVAMYGRSEVTKAGVTILKEGNHDSHTCYNNRGWCRPRCYSHETELSWENGVCGSYICCYPR